MVFPSKEKKHMTRPSLLGLLLKIGNKAFLVKGIIQPLETVKKYKYSLWNLKRIAN